MAESLSGTYNRNANIQDRAELDRWLQEPAAEQPKPEPKPEEKPPKPSALMKGVQATGEAFAAGRDKILSVLTKGPTHGAGPTGAAKEILDGLIGMATSPAAGVGAGVQQGFENISPEMAKTVILKGGPGGPAKLVRAMLGSSAFSPKQTAEERVGNEADMTAGELANIASSMAALIYGPKVVGKMRGKGGPTEVPQIPEPAERVPQQPLQLEAGAPPKMLEAGTPEQGVRVGQATPLGESSLKVPLEERRLLPPGEPPKMLTGNVPEPLPTAIEVGARRYGMQNHEFVADALHSLEKDFSEIMEGKDVEGPLRSAAEVATEKTAPLDQTPSALDAAMRRAKDLMKDEGGAVDPALLARIGIGAALGCATADNGEDCAKRALIGAGIAAPLSAKMAKAVANRLTGMPETVAEQQKKSSGVAVQASEQPYQPNYQRLDMTPAVKNLMVNVHRSLKEDILERRGPAKTNDATVRMALENIDSGKFTAERVLTLGDQEVLNEWEITAARLISKRSFEHVIELRDQILRGEPVPEGSYKQAKSLAGALGTNTRVAQTRQGQALQANNIKLGQEKFAYRAEDVAHLADEMEPGMTDQQMAMADATIKSPEQMGKAATFMALFPRAGLQALYFSYLSGKAALRNVVGNATMMGLDVMDTGIGRFMPTWDNKQAIMPGEATVRARALGEALIDHVRMLKHLDELDAEAARMGFRDTVKKSEMRQPAMKDLALSMGAEEGGTIARLGDWADKITSFPGEVLDKTDLASKAINGRMEMHSQAMYQASREGLSGEKFWNRVGQLTDDPTQLSRSARERMIEVAEEATFTKEFEGRITRALAAGPENEWGNLVYRSMVMPFFRVAARMTEQGMVRTPLLNFAAKQFWEDWLAGGVRRQKAEARIVGGAAIIGSFMYLESQGMVTGNRPKDPKLAKLWEDAGYQDRSFYDPMAGKWRSYDGLGPITNLVSTAADTSMAARKLPESDAAHLFFSYLLSTVNNLDSRTFTQSISNLMDVIKSPSSDSQVEKAMDFLRKQVAGWAKPGVVREIETLVDPEVRRPVRSGAYDEDSLSGSLGREFQMLLDEVRAGWPGWSSEKDAEGNYLVPPSRDRLTGEPTIVESWPFNPFNGKTPKPLPFERPATMPPKLEADVRKEIIRLNGAGLEPIQDWIGGGNPGASSGFVPDNVREGVRLTGQAKDRYTVLMLKELKDEYGDTYAQAMARQMADPTYWAQSDGLRGPDGGKAVLLGIIDKKFHQMAEQKLYEESPKLAGRVLLRKAERAIQKTPTEQQPDARSMIQNMIKSLNP